MKLKYLFQHGKFRNFWKLIVWKGMFSIKIRYIYIYICIWFIHIYTLYIYVYIYIYICIWFIHIYTFRTRLKRLSSSSSIHLGKVVSEKNMYAAAKSLQSCPTLCDPMDCSLSGFSVHGILEARTLEWVAISFSNAWKWKVKVKSLSHVWLLVTPWTAAHQALPSMGFSGQQYWSGVPLPSPRTCIYAYIYFVNIPTNSMEIFI